MPLLPNDRCSLPPYNFHAKDLAAFQYSAWWFSHLSSFIHENLLSFDNILRGCRRKKDWTFCLFTPTLYVLENKAWFTASALSTPYLLFSFIILSMNIPYLEAFPKLSLTLDPCSVNYLQFFLRMILLINVRALKHMLLLTECFY